MFRKIIRVAIIETDVFGVKAYECKCWECGWTTPRFAKETTADKHARNHVCKEAK